MNKNSWLILIVVLVLIGGCAGFLVRLQAAQRLGQPGLKVVTQPILDETGKVASPRSVYLPAKVLDYESEPIPVTQKELSWLPPDTTFGRRHYTAPDGFWTDISVVLMGADRTSIHQPQYCLTGQGFRIDRTETTTISIEKPYAYQLPIKKLTTSKEFLGNDGRKVAGRGIYVYWFVADGQITADHSERMWWMARDLIREGTLQRWAYVTYFAICRPGQEEPTFERMKKIIAASAPEFQLKGDPSSGKAASLAGARP